MQSIAEQIVTIHRRNWPETPCRVEDIQHLFQEYRLSSDILVPNWLRWLIARLANQEQGKLTFHDLDPDSGAVLTELIDLLSWDGEDYGEGVEIRFPRDHLEIFLSQEALDENGNPACACYIFELGKPINED